MISREEIERLARSINALRPEWPTGSLVTFIHKRHEQPLRDLALSLTFIALDPTTQTPARVDQDGPWKKILAPTEPSWMPPRPAEMCVICNRTQAAHHREDHEYDNRPRTGTNAPASLAGTKEEK